MIPRWQKIGLIECSNCGWKREISVESCPMCGSSSYNKPIKPKKRENIQLKFDINKLRIVMPPKYILKQDRINFKNTDDFFSLVSNYKELRYSKNMLLRHSDEIITKANSIFIENEKIVMRNQFNEDIANHVGIFTEEDKKNLRIKYNKGYMDYWDLSYESLIDKTNQRIIEEEKNIVLKEFNERLSVCRHIITYSEKEKLRKEFNKDYFNFYNELNFDDLIDNFNEELIKNQKQFDSKRYISQSEDYSISVEEIISKIDCNLFKSEELNSNDLNKEFEEFINLPIFDIIVPDLRIDERSKLVTKIKKDISDNKISGDIADIIEFYFNQYKSIKKQYALNCFLNEYIKSDNFNNLLNSYDIYAEDIISKIIDHVRKDIHDDELMDEDKIKLKLDYYFKVESNKFHYSKQIDEIRKNSQIYINKYHLIEGEFLDILEYIQIKVDEGFYIKNINNCITNKIKEKVDLNRNDCRLKLKKLLNNPEFIENNNISQEKLDQLNEYVGGLIYNNKIRSNEINEDFLLTKLREDYYELY